MGLVGIFVVVIMVIAGLFVCLVGGLIIVILVGCLVLVSAREGPPGLPPTTGRGAAAGPRWT